jgi:Ca2+-binding RTX toxin-like protein
MGADADLFSFDPEPFSFYQPVFSQYFPIVWPLGIKLEAEIGASFDIAFGYDSAGIVDYFAGGETDPSVIYNGFYVQAYDLQGNPTTHIGLAGTLLAYAAGNVAFAEIGIGGDLTATLQMQFGSGLAGNDGKIRAEDFANAEVFELFDGSGELSAALHAYVELGVGPFSIPIEFESPRATILSLDFTDADPPVLATPSGDTLLLNVGQRWIYRGGSGTTDRGEELYIVGKDDEVIVSGFGHSVAYDAPARIYGDGGEQSDVLIATNRAILDILDPNLPIIGYEPFFTPVEFHGGNSRDILGGAEGNDLLFGDDGADSLGGGGGVDTLFGGNHNDQLVGGAGADVLDGGEGLDLASFITALAGMTIDLRTMTFTGDGVGDTFVSIERYEGTNFADTIVGNDLANALLSGRDGNDLIQGLDGQDALDGGKGNDTLEAGGGDDFLIGGAGGDRLDGGLGNDTISYITSTSSVTLDLEAGTGTGGDAAGDSFVSIEGIIGTLYGDSLRGHAGNDFISGLAGSDSIAGASGADLIYGDNGVGLPEPYSQTVNADTVTGGAGNDTLYGQEGNDVLEGNEDNDRLLGGEGDDILDGGSGVDVLRGETGDDHLITLDLASVDTLDGGAGTNRLSADFSDKDFVFAIVAGNEASLTFDFADGDRAQFFTKIGEFHTAEGNDSVILNNGLDADFRHKIVTNGGDDTVLGSDGLAKNINGFGLFYGDTILAGAGQDYVVGGLNDDYIEGGSGNDTLYAGFGSDTVLGGSGEDFVSAGGNRFLLLATSDGMIIDAETIATPGMNQAFPEELHGGEGNDTLSFEGAGRSLTAATGPYSHGGVPFGVEVYLSANPTGVGRAGTGITISGFENVIGTMSADKLVGDDGANLILPLRGGGYWDFDTFGADSVDGAGGNDTLRIDYSVDDGGEFLKVTSGSTGGVGQFNRDINPDLAPSVADQIYWSDNVYYSNIEHFQITGGQFGDQIWGNVVGFADTLIGNGGDDVLGGTGGSDLLLGGEGSDSLFGGGAKLLFLVGDTFADGSDTLDGGAGDDLVHNIHGSILGQAPAQLNSAWLAAADTRPHLDGGQGFDTLSVDFSNQSDAIVWNSAVPTNIEFSNGSYGRNFEQITTFYGGTGNDSVTQLGAVNNHFYLNSGNDTLNPGVGRDSVYGGAGTDLLILDFSAGDSAALSGISTVPFQANNRYARSAAGSSAITEWVYFEEFEQTHITGTSKADHILGYTVADTVFGALGNDSIRASSFSEAAHLDGGEGDDYLYYIQEAGVSSIHRDSLFGGAGQDTLDASQLVGTSFLHLDGGAGNDSVQASIGDDAVFGGEGNDTLVAGSGSDSLSGGDGDDVMVLESGFQPLGVDLADGGAGNDRVTAGRMAYAFSGFGITPGQTAAVTSTRMFLDGGDGVDTLSADFGNQTEAIAFIQGQSNSKTFADGAYFRNFEVVQDLITGSGNDLIQLAGRMDNRLSTGFGSDTVNAGVGVDFVVDAGGYDLLVADFSQNDDAGLGGVTGSGFDGFVRRDIATGAIVDSITYQAPNGFSPGFERFHITGGSKGDRLTGYNDSDTLMGGGGNDTLDGHLGSDLLAGGLGDDIFYVNTAADQVIEAAGEGTDTVQASVSYTLAENVENLVLGSGVSGTGNALDNVITGSTGNEVLDGAGGNDTLIGGAGNDTLVVGSVGDVVVELAGGGTDLVRSTIDFALGANLEFLELLGAAGLSGSGNELANRLTGNAGGNNLSGGTGNDTLLGMAGDDTLNAGTGLDSVSGGADFDLLVIDWTSLAGAVVVRAVENSAAGFSGYYEARDSGGLLLSRVDLDGIERVTLNGTVEQLPLGGAGDDNILGGPGDDNLEALAGNDTVNPGTGLDTVAGGSGTDRLVIDWSGLGTSPVTLVGPSLDAQGGATGSVVGGPTHRVDFSGIEVFEISSADGNDTLTGFTGNDILKGGAGQDLLDGAAGADTLFGGLGDDVFRVDDAGDVVVEDAGSGTDLVEAGVSIALGAAVENLRLTGVANLTGTGHAGSNRIEGNAGDNLLLGLHGSDSLYGGAGNDTLRLESEASLSGQDVADGGEGDDFVVAQSPFGFFVPVDPGTLLQLDAGSGLDTLSADFRAQNGPVVFNQSAPSNIEFADGSYARNFEVVQDLATGSSADAIFLSGRANNNLTTGDGNDTVNPGLGIDLVDGGDGDSDLLRLDFSVGDTAELSAAFMGWNYAFRSNAVFAFEDYVTFFGFEHLHVTGTGQGDYLLGGYGADTLLGGLGHDSLFGSGGGDSLVGGLGDDVFGIHAPTDKVVEAAGGGIDTVLVSGMAAYTLGANIENGSLSDDTPVDGGLLTGNNDHNVLVGNGVSNILVGLRGNDTLIGDGGWNLGWNSVDTLTGGLGADVFALATADTGMLYAGFGGGMEGGGRGDETLGGGSAQEDYALITDFNATQNDRLQLFGSAEQYFLGSSPVSGVAGTGVFFDSDASGTLGGTDELLAVVQSPSALTFNTLIANAQFV